MVRTLGIIAEVRSMPGFESCMVGELKSYKPAAQLEEKKTIPFTKAFKKILSNKFDKVSAEVIHWKLQYHCLKKLKKN